MTMDKKYEQQLVWRNVWKFVLLHSSGFYGLYLMFTGKIQAATIALGFLYGILSGMGVTGGAHRLWAHRAYKARLPLRIFWAYWQTAAAQNSIYVWSRDHRVHHKFSETDADPHNIKRGFFFAHMGWLLTRKHPDVMEKGKTVDVSDLEDDPVVMFQHRYYIPLTSLITIIIPMALTSNLFNEPVLHSLFLQVAVYMLVLHGTWLVNSAAHVWGHRPFDKSLGASQNPMVAVITSGEGWHNYHHAFPWDYKASELGPYSSNLTTALIDLFAAVGWAYDLRSAPEEMIIKRAKRTGDGTYSTPEVKNQPR